ncbi:MAG TPA: TonB-dependent receptor [Steroidobacteraceae bacterium]|nr:TonB-dependent receptor [Steroidobacteraceae bacterium]
MTRSLPRALAVPWVALLLLPAAALADSTDIGSSGDLKRLSLEQLMDIQVTSVTRHPGTLLEAPASIQVITGDEIRRSGATTIPEALRLADNLEVAQKNSHDWGISARGFNTALANKLLVMIDGRTVYTPLFSGVFWDVQDYLLEDIDRIEVISGPGGTLWGANAVNGVINIITRSAADSQGLYAEAGGGTQPQELVGARYGGSIAPDVSFRVYGKYADRDEEVLPGGRSAGDAWHRTQVGFRIDSDTHGPDTFTVHGDFYTSQEGVPTGNAAQTDGGNLMTRLTHVFSAESDMSLQAYYDRTHLSDPIVPFILNGMELAPAGRAHDDLSTYDLDFQHRFALGSWQRIVWGLGYRLTQDRVESAPALGFFPAELNQNLFSAFAQDEMSLGSAWRLIIGSKVEHNDYTGYEFEPNVRLQWNGVPQQTIWSAVSRAARTPSRIDRDLAEPAPPRTPILAGSPRFGSEYVTAYELGYRGQLAPPLSASLSLFYNSYRDVRSTSLSPTILPLFFANNLEGHTSGVELSTRWRLTDAWSMRVGYEYLNEDLRVKPGAFDLNSALNETADPRHQASLRSSWSLPGHLELDMGLRWVDSLTTNSGPVAGRVPSYYDLDTRIGWRCTARLEFALVGQNLLHDHHTEYGFPGPDRIEIERGVYGKMTWRE